MVGDPLRGLVRGRADRDDEGERGSAQPRRERQGDVHREASQRRVRGEESLTLDRDTVFDGIALGGYKLIVELNTPLFQRFDTLSKLRAAADTPKFVKEHGPSLFMKTAVPGRTTASLAGRFVESGGTIYGTIVKSLRWAGKPYPGAEIDDNVITIPDCGDIYFGEIYISGLRRRLTMLRMDLCCPQPMRLMMADVEGNGTWGV